jgi:putative hydrolase of the HAD superfamily
MIRILGFDADDTLWHNESIFERAHERYRALLARYHPVEEVNRVLYATELRNLALYGYGVKGYMLSCVEAAIELTQGAISAVEIREIIGTGQEMLAHPVELLPGVVETVPGLAGSRPRARLPAAADHEGRPASPGAKGGGVGPDRTF